MSAVCSLCPRHSLHDWGVFREEAMLQFRNDRKALMSNLWRTGQLRGDSSSSQCITLDMLCLGPVLSSLELMGLSSTVLTDHRRVAPHEQEAEYGSLCSPVSRLIAPTAARTLCPGRFCPAVASRYQREGRPLL